MSEATRSAKGGNDVLPGLILTGIILTDCSADATSSIDSGSMSVSQISAHDSTHGASAKANIVTNIIMNWHIGRFIYANVYRFKRRPA